jgi:hypothetical protein
MVTRKDARWPTGLPISQRNPGLRKITRNLYLDFAAFGWTGQLRAVSFLILIARFATIDSWLLVPSHPCTT